MKITRDTKFAWDSGRRLFELVAPSGRVYAMQSYSKIVDPTMSYKRLKNLGPKLNLPDGWRFRTRRPDSDLVLRVSDHATIIQDDFRNTYQREPKGFSAH